MNLAPEMTSAIPSGFDDPAMESQAVFRAVLKAFSNPGRIVQIALGESPPPPLADGSAAIALSLFDLSTPVWLAPRFQVTGVRDYLTFHTGSPVSPDRQGAHFALMGADDASAGVADFSIGTPEYPDRSATVIIQVSSLNTGGALRLRGPGIETTHKLSIDGLEPSFWTDIRRNQKLFPLGLDFIFVAGDRIACLPRTTKVEV